MLLPALRSGSGSRIAPVLIALVIAGLAVVNAGEAKANILDDVAVKLEPIVDGFPYVEPGTTGKASFLFTNAANRELRLTWKAQVTLPEGLTLTAAKVPDLEEQITLPAGGSKRIAIADQFTQRRGVITFAWQMTDQDGRSLALKDNLAVMTLPGPELSHRANFRFGWGTGLVHFVFEPNEIPLMPLYAKMGCDLIRVGDTWAYSESRGYKSSANANNGYWKDAESTLSAASTAGMDLLYVMWGTPPNLAREGFSRADTIEQLAKANDVTFGLMQRVRPPDPVAWKKRVTDTVTKMKDKVKFWEIWNDQDRSDDGSHHMPNGWVGNTSEYIELLRDASTTIKAIDPKLTVLNGGFFTVGQSKKHDLNPDMVPRVVSEAQSSFDIMAGFDSNPAILLGPMADLRKQFTTPKPLWLTRVEQHGSSPDELVRRLLSAKGCGASAFVWMWALSFDSGWRGFLVKMNSWKTKERKANNIHSLVQMSPASVAYVHAIGLLRLLSPSGRLDTGTNGQWLFAFADTAADTAAGTADRPKAKAKPKSKQQVVGLWLEDKMTDTTVQMRVGANAVCTLIDLYGNAEPVAVTSGTVKIPLRRIPAYLSIVDGDPVALAR